jgi:hypothetical protein
MKVGLFIVSMLTPAMLFAQVEDSDSPSAAPPPSADVIPVNNVTTPSPAAAAALPSTAHAGIPGNAGGYVTFVAGKADCREGMRAIAIKNTSAKVILAGVDMSMYYNGHVNSKDIRVDNLAPNEVRTLGCSGCAENPSGKTCTKYKIKAALFK